MRSIRQLIYKLKLFLKFEKPYKPGPQLYYKVAAINKADAIPEVRQPVAFVKTDDGRTISFNHVPGATGYRVNGQRTEIIAIK